MYKIIFTKLYVWFCLRFPLFSRICMRLHLHSNRTRIFETLIVRFIARADFRYSTGLINKSVPLVSRVSRCGFN